MTARLRKATIHDIDILVSHHVDMFIEIFDQKKESTEPVKMKKMAENYRLKLKKQLADGSCCMWLIEEGPEICASAGVTYHMQVPTPVDPQNEIAYLHTVYTLPAYRGRGHAATLVKQCIEHARARGVGRIDLGASDAGRPIYERLGFKAYPQAMRMFLEKK